MVVSLSPAPAANIGAHREVERFHRFKGVGMATARQPAGLVIENLTGEAAVTAALPDLARLRITVFQEFPYLYDGSLDYEAEYLKIYARTPGALVVAARDPSASGRLVGAATGMPLAAEHEELLRAFRTAGMALDDLYYCAESVLEPQHRGLGIGHAFFDRREAFARDLGYRRICFLAVERPIVHARKPTNYRPLDAFWRKRGYAEVEGFRAHFTWRDLDESAPSAKPMKLWMRAL
jgi:GNAT superfamily N-acetyltransferase